ncbi:MAG: CDGSH iron-sulfur domain-containing protein [Mariprofundaceae bacterium]
MGRIHRYQGEEIIVEFDLGRCIHSGDCSRDLAEVFNTKRTGRWVSPDAAEAEKVARVCADCPTGALRCIHKTSGEVMAKIPTQNTVQSIADGPLYVHANMTLNGEPMAAYRAAFCRCGASRLMPFCDNSHQQAAFHDSGKINVPLPSPAPDSGKLHITTIKDGPLMLEGPFTLLDNAGNSVCSSAKAALCRCGESNMKPYCDGSHQRIGFETT